jgi:two-component system chemotaxis response regulator CheB
MPAAFTRSFAERLDKTCALSVHEAFGGERLVPGMAVLAPGGAHMRLLPDLTVELAQAGTAESRHVPSVDELMRSAAQARGRRVVGVLLTGMGEDGADGMAAIRAAGGLTIAESEASCVVYGMPRAAHARGVVQHMLPLAEIRKLLCA